MQQLTCGKKCFGAVMDLSKGEAPQLLFFFFFFAWFTLTEKYRKPNYRAAAKGFNNAQDLCRVKQHGSTRGNVIQGVKVNQAGKAINLRC